MTDTTNASIVQLRAVPNTPVDGWSWHGTKDATTGTEFRLPFAREVIAAAKLGLDEGTLACVLASEFPTEYPAYLLAGAHCVINDATALYPDKDGRGRTEGAILARVTRAKNASGCFARQSGRWCSSWQAPTQRTLAAARLALRGVGAELAAGGRRWLDLKVQDGGKQAGGALPATEAVLRSRYAEGWRLVPPDPRIDDYILAILAREGVSLADALERLRLGRLRWHVTTPRG